MVPRSKWRAAGIEGSPPAPRGSATRADLLVAARQVFERDGFLGAKTTVIADEAGVARGSFYTYFRDKEEVFAAVLLELRDEMLHPPVIGLADRDDPIEVIRVANRAYLQSYRRNRVLLAQMEVAALLSEEFRRIRQERTAAFNERNARAIAGLQERGLVDTRLDPRATAVGLSAMVSGIARQVFVYDVGLSMAEAVELTTTMYVNALGIAHG